MKKVIFMLLAGGLVISTSSVLAGDTSFGARVGISLANMAGADVDALIDDEKKGRIGLSIGGYVGIPLGTSLIFQPELLYVQKGVKDVFEEGGGKSTVTFMLDYIEIPILVKYVIPTSGSVTPSLYAGPFIGFLASSKGNSKVSFAGFSLDEDFELEKDEMNSTEFGLVFGGGLDINKIAIDIRYDLGLTSPFKADEGEDALKVTNSAIQITVGVNF